MRLEQLQYFLSIAKTHSISKTSLEFYTTHQSVSKSIRQLEDEVGAPLFTRSKKGMELTPEGELLLPAAESSLKELHNALLRIRHINRRQEISGTLGIWSTTLTNVAVLPGLFEDFSLLYPQIQYDIHTADPLTIFRNVSLHKTALGFSTILRSQEFHEFYEPYIHQVSLTPLLRDEFACMVVKTSPLAERTQLSFEEFASYPVTTSLPDAHEDHPIRQLLQRYGNTNTTFFTQSPRLIAQSILSGKYVCLSTLHGHSEINYLNLDEKDVVLIPFSDDLSFDIMLVTNLLAQFDEISQAFVDIVKERSTSL